MYFESHAHYNDSRYDEDRDVLLNNLLNNDIDFIINIGTSIESSISSLDIAKKYDKIYAAVGIHPHNVEFLEDDTINTLEKLALNSKSVAIGEIGLDYFYDNSPREFQQKWFKIQLELAEKLNLPVIIHSREADQACFDIIKNSNVRRGVIHCYSGSVEMAKEYIKLGFYIGVGGVVTFSKSKTLVNVVSEVSIDNILIETDSPYLTPNPNRGKRNDSSNLKYITEKIAEIKGITIQEVARTSLLNAKHLFDII
jgi:TatD DNase family protein